ncbi:MAG: hypothetical protein M1837_003366 [Sclerophora amabilis]|nr:MAG: hypothetical protein M1837_003366 [Sclerophora amabilis]
MSLNGLDNDRVKKVYQSAISQPDGWFLLKYVSRDEVDLLGEGTEGISELREALTAYPEQSPLYGYAHFRHKAVLIKYVPEGISRLLQARVTVHLQAVIDNFPTHDAVYSLSAPADLNEASLSAACSLHATSDSTSTSAASSHPAPLGGTGEDTKESHPTTNREHVRSTSTSRANLLAERATPQLTTLSENTAEQRHEERPGGDLRMPMSAPTTQGLERCNTAATVPSTQDYGGAYTSLDQTSILERSGDRRTSFNSTRSTLRDPYSSYAFKSKPKVKVGPRPSLDSVRRPHTSGSVPRQQDGPRPVSTLPAGIKMAPRKTNVASRPPSRQASDNNQATPTMPQTPRLSSYTNPHPLRPATSSGSIASRATLIPDPTPPMPSLTPEKQRLMKALQMRKTQLSKSTQDQASREAARSLAEKCEAVAIEAEMSLPKDNRTKEMDLSKAEPSLSKDNNTKETIRTETEPLPLEDDRSKKTVSIDALPSPLEEGAKDTSSANAKDQQREAVADDRIVPSIEPLMDKAYSSPISPAESSELGSTKASSLADEKDHDLSERQESLSTSKSSSEVETTQDLGNPSLEASPPSPSTIEQSSKTDNVQSMIDDTTAVVERTKAWSNSSTTSLRSLSTTQLGLKSPEQNGNSSDDILTIEVDGTDLNPVGLDSDHGSAGAFEHGSTRDTYLPSRSSFTTKAESRPVSMNLKVGSTRRKSRGRFAPMPTDVGAENSEDNLSDESFLDELKTATVQEAKPISVTRSPITPFFPSSPNNSPIKRVLRTNRAASSPVESFESTNGHPSPNKTDPARASSRTVSGSLLNTSSCRQAPVAQIKKVNLSSGISQRIKALEMLSSQRESSVMPTMTTSSTPSASPPYPPPRNASLRSLTSSTDSASPPNVSSQERLLPLPPSKSVPTIVPQASKLDPTRRLRKNMARPESISVKAQIVRESSPHFLKARSISEPNNGSVLELHPSPLTIDHQRAYSPLSHGQTATPKGQGVDVTTTALSINVPPPSDVASPTDIRSTSMTSRRSSSRSRYDIKSPVSVASSSSSTVAEGDEKRSSKKESSRSRLLRRMSSISSASRKSLINVISPTVREETIQESKSLPLARRVSMDMGEVNVQFPDNLVSYPVFHGEE